MPETAEKGRFFGNYFAKKREMRAMEHAFSAPFALRGAAKEKERTHSFRSLFSLFLSASAGAALLCFCANNHLQISVVPSGYFPLREWRAVPPPAELLFAFL